LRSRYRYILIFTTAALCLGQSPSDVRIGPHRKTPRELESLERVLWLDFGHPRGVPGGAVGYRNDRDMPGAWWARGQARPQGGRSGDSFLRDFFEGFDATLVVDVDSLADYRGILTLGDLSRARGPVDVFVNGRLVADGVTTKPREFIDIEFAFASPQGRLEVRLKTDQCSTFAVPGLSLYTKDPRTRRPTWGARAQAPAIVKPDLGDDPLSNSASAVAPDGAMKTLRTYCDFLMENRSSDGGFSYRGAWYETSFAVRTLLIAAKLLNDDRYREAAYGCLDRFAEEQREDGSWSAEYFGRGPCPEAQQLVNDARSVNLADVGSMALCLAFAAPAADPDRRERYLHAARRYADEIILPNQLESGAFPNLRWQGQDYRTPYSVATGTQAANLAALGLATGDSRYSRGAERAALFLASNIDSDGSVEFHRFDRRPPAGINPGSMGNIFYIIDGLLWVRFGSGDVIRTAIDITLAEYLTGDNGLLNRVEDSKWWTDEDPWEGSKRAALLYLIETARAMGVAGLDHQLPWPGQSR